MGDPSIRSNTQRSDRSVRAIKLAEFADYRGTAEPLLPVLEVSSVQLQPGPALTNMTIFSSDKVSILGVRHNAASVGVVIIEPCCYSFMWWDGGEECRINGELARRSVLYAQGAQDGFHATGGKRQTMGIAVRRTDFIETVAALRGVGPEDVLLNRSALDLTAGAATRFRAGVDMLIRSAIGPGPGNPSGAGTVDPSEAIFGLLVDAYLHAPPRQLQENWARPPEQIVRQAEERFFAAQGAPVSLADLCAATGVSQSALYRAFRTVCDEPPLAYFRKRRFTAARRALIKSPAHRGGVKSAAIAAGLTELGRFAIEYRRLFGEAPSTTLNRVTQL
ncbi:helix-turn-helix domain-containing protein [Rhodobium gokarnense]|uniref:AraC-like DNA-binding protein n=1 Tax=Rhodobium gokarnense TaxID=364296 RepID=A0ABT3HC89_9HYPH|nr:helix-turn-helix domain-containing protein [Rhodobium gokarnense]MCW2308012.1 AraC-like DNA-binding protein [Rhodobium gokarnense]